MYTPKLFARKELEELLPLMREAPFATVITIVDEAPVVSHLPLMAEEDESGAILLTGHMARANPHWRHLGRHFAEGGETLFIFHGPQTYVTPSWYKDPMNVPTWNYAVVHAYAAPELVEDYEGIHGILERSVQFFEKSERTPWKFSLPEDFKHELVGAIVGFQARVSRIEGKFKLSQNRDPEDRAGVLEGLAKRPDEMSRKVLEMMNREKPTTGDGR